jgi:hypothetical protein
MRTLRARVLVPTILCGLLAAIAACSDDDDNPYSPPPDPDAIATDLTDPVDVIEAHEKALRKKNYAAYDALLDADFEFFPLEEDAIDFPWMTSESWSRTEELSIMSHMFDPNFAGENPPISSIEVEIPILSQQALPNGGTQVDCIFLGRLLTSPTDGWSFDTRILFELIPRNGYLRMSKAVEVPRTRPGRRDFASVEESSWGSLKGLYR